MNQASGREIRYFYAHKKDTPDSDIDSSVRTLTDRLRAAIAPSWPRVISGRDDYAARSKVVGGWKGWQRSVAVEVTISGEPLFDAYIVPDQIIGRATAEMLRMALGTGKPVVYLAPDGSFRRVLDIVTENDRSWKDGWRLVLGK